MKHPRNPYANTKRRRAALAYLAARGLTQVRPVYPAYAEIEITRLPQRTAPRRLVLVS